jgi:hypothetical protein
MIAEFRFKNFLSIKSEQCLSFEVTPDTLMKEEYSVEVNESVRLLKTALIYGANASGKTNILIALSFFRDLMVDVPKDKTEEIDFTPFYLDNISRNEKTELSMIFYLESERYVLSVTLDKTRIYTETLMYYPGVQPAKLFARAYNEQTDSTDIEFGPKLGLSKKGQLAIAGNTINNCTVMAAFGKSNVESSRLNVVYDFFSKHTNDILRPVNSVSGYIKKHLDKDKDNSLKTFLVDLLKASDFNISDFRLNVEEELITSEMEKMINASPIPEEAKLEMIQKGKISKYDLMFKHQTDNGEFELPEDLESRGTIRFMGTAILLKQLLKENIIVSIDEVETSLHYELLS